MKIEVGQWYRCREEKFIAHVVGPIKHGKYKFAAVIYRQGEFEHTACFTARGSFSYDQDERMLDLVEHLPDCTGPDWKPQKWRKARPEDAIAKKECKVTGVSLTFPAVLSGVRFGLNNDVRFYVYDGNGFLWYDSDCVEVLDD